MKNLNLKIVGLILLLSPIIDRFLIYLKIYEKQKEIMLGSMLLGFIGAIIICYDAFFVKKKDTFIYATLVISYCIILLFFIKSWVWS